MVAPSASTPRQRADRCVMLTRYAIMPCESRITGGNDRCRFDHQDDRTVRRTRSVHHALGHHIALARLEVDRLAFQVDDEVTLEDKKELVIVVMLVPVILTLQDTKPDHGLVDF